MSNLLAQATQSLLTPGIKRLLEFPDLFLPWIFEPHRYKVGYGGRGSAKSWTFARALIIYAHCAPSRRPERIGCFREIQTSIADSVHQLLADQIEEMGLLPWFRIFDKSITSTLNGSEFIFKGLKHNKRAIKSTEGLTKVWVEEAELVEKDSWEILIPTVRGENSEIWVTFNPVEETDDTYRRFVLTPPPDAIVKKINYKDNPYFPGVLELERRYMEITDPDAYEHVWNGSCKTISDAVIFKNRYVIDTFDTPPQARFFHGADFGFADDPATLMRSYITHSDPTPEEIAHHEMVQRRTKLNLPPLRKEELWVDAESYGFHVENNDLDALYDVIPTSRTWPIKADNSRPETISHVRGLGFNITAADKWPGCVEDRIAHLKSYRIIHIHTRCKHFKDEARLYRYKVDKVTGQVLPLIVDKHNHGWDSVGYSLDGHILRRGKLARWANG